MVDHLVFKSGFVTLWGRPNVGKSTFINSVLDHKISIVSEKPQTTRKMIKGILNRLDCQIVFIDTPGLHVPVDPLGKYLSYQWQSSLLDADCLLYLTTPDTKPSDDRPYLEQLRSFHRPVFLVINKADLYKTDSIQKAIQMLSGQFPFHQSFAISALTRSGLEECIQKIKEILPENPPFFDLDQISDTYERDIVGEIIREKIWLNIYQEIPYGVEVRVEEFTERQDLIYIRAIIYVEKNSHRKIIIGREGSMLKKIGSEARKDIENLLGRGVYLDLWVKTQLNWRNKTDILKRWGYTTR